MKTQLAHLQTNDLLNLLTSIRSQSQQHAEALQSLMKQCDRSNDLTKESALAVDIVRLIDLLDPNVVWTADDLEAARVTDEDQKPDAV